MAEQRLCTVRSVAEFCSDEEKLRSLIQTEQNPICFDAFEPTGRMPIAQGLIKTLMVNRLVEAGCSVRIWLGDWTAEQKLCLKNDKTKLRVSGEHMIEVWKAIGMKVDKVEFLWASEVINGPRTAEFWPLVLDVARRSDLPRMFKCLGISEKNLNKMTDKMAEKDSETSSEQEKLPSSELLYPCMQTASLFLTEAHICLLGLDKRNETEMIGEYCDDFAPDRKPVFLSNSILHGLDSGLKEMSRKTPENCIFMEDEESDIKTKIKRAFCPPNEVEKNPCIELLRLIVFPWCREFEIQRVPANGGDKTFTSMEDLCSDYSAGSLHPADLKAGLMKSLNRILQPVRDHLKANSNAKDLLMKVKKLKLT